MKTREFQDKMTEEVIKIWGNRFEKGPRKNR